MDQANVYSNHGYKRGVQDPGFIYQMDPGYMNKVSYINWIKLMLRVISVMRKGYMISGSCIKWIS